MTVGEVIAILAEWCGTWKDELLFNKGISAIDVYDDKIKLSFTDGNTQNYTIYKTQPMELTDSPKVETITTDIISAEIVDYKDADENKNVYATCSCLFANEAIEIPRPLHTKTITFNCPKCGRALGVVALGRTEMEQGETLAI